MSENIDSNGNKWRELGESEMPTIPESATQYDVYYTDAKTGFGIGTGDRFSVHMDGGEIVFGKVIAIQTMEPWQITALMDGEASAPSVVREFLPKQIQDVFPKPRGTR